MVGFVIYCVFKENSSLKVKVIYPKYYECWKCWLQFVLEKGLKIFIFVSWNGWFSEWNYWFWVTVPEQMVEKPPQFWTLVVLKIERLLNICCLSYPFDLLHYNRYLEKMKWNDWQVFWEWFHHWGEICLKKTILIGHANF